MAFRIRNPSCGVPAKDAVPKDAKKDVAPKDVATALAPLVAPRRLLFLQGAIGTGKTQLARALLQSLTDDETLVPSPTFTLLQPYETRRGAVLHADLYRLQPKQTCSLGLEEALQKGFVMIEWAERLHPALKHRLLTRTQLLHLHLSLTGEKSVCSAVLTLPRALATDALRALEASSKNKTSNNKTRNNKTSGGRSVVRLFPPSPAVTRAFVLAAGLGRRMRTYAQKPKPLVEVGGKPLLLHAIEKLREQGVSQIFVNAHYRVESMLAACKGLAGVVVLEERELLETGGGIERALPLLGEQPFFALNADALWYDPPTSPPLLACLASSWQSLACKTEATTLLALLEQRGARDVQALAELDDPRETFPLVFPVPACEHRQDVPQNAHQNVQPFRYIGVQILTARAFRSIDLSPSVSPSVSPRKRYSLTRLYAQEAAAGRLYGLLACKRWQGRWLHVGDRAALLQARRTWKKLVAKP